MKKPFSKDFVIKTTLAHQRKCVDISIQKTANRIAEFEGDAEMSKEILQTLSCLHSMRDALNV